MSDFDAIVVGAGPNGLSAAVHLAKEGAKVLVLEGADTIGGGTRTSGLTLPGYAHDFCSAVHPMGALSPFFRTLDLERYGLEWVSPSASVAHPLEGESAVIHSLSLEETAEELGVDGASWKRMVTPFLKRPHDLFHDALGPLRFPRDPFQLTRFGVQALFPASVLAKLRFRGKRARALFGGHSAHSILPMERPLSAAVGLMFAVSGHVVDWPMAVGGSVNITKALARLLEALGGEVRTGCCVEHVDDLPAARVVLFDTDPRQLASIAESVLPAGYVRRLRKYRYGPGTFKVDWALEGSIPWKDPRCAGASTVHVCGTLEEIAQSERDAWRGVHCERPFVMVCQQSEFDRTRAPEGKHTGYAYCHVPHGSSVDMTEAIERQIERFAPGFRALILHRHSTSTQAFALHNRNNVGGAITGGVADLFQLFTRPVMRVDPYSTPNDRIFLCSHSTPPGGGVHGMCGFFAAKSALKRLHRKEVGPFRAIPRQLGGVK